MTRQEDERRLIDLLIKGRNWGNFGKEQNRPFMEFVNQMYPHLEEPHPILSVRPPWAYAILRGGKDVENRKWQTPYRGPLYIHVSKTFEDKEEKRQFYVQYPNAKIGGVAGIVDLVDCVKGHPSRWAMPDHWHWILANPREIGFVQMKGKLGLFKALEDKKHPCPLRPLH